MKKLALIAIVVVLSTSLISGCISTNKPKQTIYLFYGENTMDYDEVVGINDTIVKNNIEKNSYNITIENNPDYPPNCEKNVYVWKGERPDNFFQIYMQAYRTNNTTYAKISISYWNPYIDDDKLEDYTKSKVKEIVTVCNITLDVNNIKWVISYKD